MQKGTPVMNAKRWGAVGFRLDERALGQPNTQNLLLRVAREQADILVPLRDQACEFSRPRGEKTIMLYTSDDDVYIFTIAVDAEDGRVGRIDQPLQVHCQTGHLLFRVLALGNVLPGRRSRR